MPQFIPIIAPIIKKLIIQFIVSAIVSKVFGKKKARGRGQGASTSSQILINKSGNNEPIPVVYGRQRVGGVRAFINTTNGSGGSGNNILNEALILCEGEVGAPLKVFFGETLVWHASSDGGSGTTSTVGTDGYQLANFETTKYGSHYIAFYPGTTTQTVDPTLQASIGSSTWDNNRRLQGLAYLALKLPTDDDYNGAAPEIFVEFAGKKIRAATNPVGSAVAAVDQNPADVLLDYMTNTIYGKSIPDADIDLASFASARTYMASRFKINGFLDTGQKLFDNIEEILSACNGILTYTNGKYKLRARQQNETSAFSFNTSNIIGAFDISLPPKTAKFNKVEYTFNNITTNFQDDIKVVSNNTYLTEDNSTVLLGKQDTTLVSDAAIVTNLANWMMNNSRNQTTIVFEASHQAIDVEAGDIIDITHDITGYSAKKFRVQEIILTEDNTIKITCQEYTSSIQI